MKRIILVLLCLGLLAGCSGTQERQGPQIDQIAAQNATIEILSRNLAYAVGRNNPKILNTAIAFCSSFEAEGVNLEPMIEQGLNYIDVEVADYPFLREDLQSLLSIFGIPVLMDENVPLTSRQKEMVRLAARAMKRGFEEAKVNPKVMRRES